METSIVGLLGLIFFGSIFAFLFIVVPIVLSDPVHGEDGEDDGGGIFW